MPVTNRAMANTFTYFDATLLDAAFQVCDPGIPEPVFLLRIINDSDANVLISYDGVYANDIVLAGSEIVLPFQENDRVAGRINLLKRGTPVYVAEETNPGKSGNIYVISYYQPTIG